jgi:hypothetical protein
VIDQKDHPHQIKKDDPGKKIKKKESEFLKHIWQNKKSHSFRKNNFLT